MTRYSVAPLPQWPVGGVSPEVLSGEIAAWAGSPALTDLVTAFGGEIPGGDLAARLAYLREFSEVWDFRGGGERFAARYREYDEATHTLVEEASAALGLTDRETPGPARYDHLLILGGGRLTGRARSRYAAELLRGGITAGSVAGLGSLRVLPPATSHTDPGSAAEQTEGDAMQEGVREAFPPDGPVRENSGVTPEGNPWWVRSYTSGDRPVHVIAAPPTRPGLRADTADTLRGWARLVGRPSADARVLLVTTDLYVPFQHVDAIKTLGLDLRCGIETVGFSRRTFPHWPSGPAKHGELLQEIRSAILSLHNLLRQAAHAGV